MKKTFLLVLIAKIFWTVPILAVDALKNDLKFLGYSEEMHNFFKEHMPTKPKIQVTQPPRQLSEKELQMEEAQAVQEQLTELGRTRSLTPKTPSKAAQTKDKLNNFWKSMEPQPTPTTNILPAALKSQLKNNMQQALTAAGFEIKQLDLIDIPNLPQVRAVVRVIKPLHTKDTYKEIQRNLAEVKKLCMEASTIDGVTYLGEMTTFVAENPRNKYYYEKTILNP